MTKEIFLNEMTLYRALTALKTLDKRINTRICSVKGCAISFPNSQAIMVQQEDSASISSSFQSIVDLIEYRRKIKSAISLANSCTTVKVADKEMKIAEALEMKSAISYKESLITELKRSLSVLSSQREAFNQNKSLELSAAIKHQVSDNFDIDSFVVNFWKINRCEILDPLNLGILIPKLEDEVAQFIENVDVALAEVNAKTIIKIA